MALGGDICVLTGSRKFSYYFLSQHEVEYVEGYDELEEEDDMEDFGGLALKESDEEEDDGIVHFYVKGSSTFRKILKK